MDLCEEDLGVVFQNILEIRMLSGVMLNRFYEVWERIERGRGERERERLERGRGERKRI